MKKTESQNSLILQHLLLGCSITDLEALSWFRCRRLAARIYNLKQQGFEIKTTLIPTDSGKSIARYSL